MTVETSLEEAELLIALLTFAEGAAATLNPPLVEALNDLRSWRSLLLRSYLQHRAGTTQAAK